MATKKKTKKKAAPKRQAKSTAPKPGMLIEKIYKGRKITVKVTDDGFVYRGKTYASLTALAMKVTGYAAVSGPRFFGLVGPKAKREVR